MSDRFFLSLTMVMIASLSGQTMPRTADGHPDLQGIWTNATLTPLERSAAFAGKLTASDAEATIYEKRQKG